jgi:hypothetical protein
MAEGADEALVHEVVDTICVAIADADRTLAAAE